ncbi:MAG: choice-of-anchor D domain-containing protein, partial [Terracidiphilus sp.]
MTSRGSTEVDNEVRGRPLWVAASLCATGALALVFKGTIKRAKVMRNSAMLAVGLLAGHAAAQIATPAVPVLAFNPAQVGISAGSAQTLTATFAVSGYTGSFTPTATLHYDKDYSMGSVDCTVTGATESCAIPITFQPKLPGGRKDAIFLMNGSKRMATILLGGVGQAPLSLVQPGVVTDAVPSTNSWDLYDVAIDENDVAYVICDNCASPKTNVWSVQGEVMTPIPVTFTSTNGNAGPSTIAIDGAGVLYFTVGGYLSSLVTYDTVTGTVGSFPTLPAGWPGCSKNSYNYLPQYLDSVAVDQWGNIFVHEGLCQEVIEFKPDGSYIATNVPGNSPGSPSPTMVAVDANDNIFVSGPNTVETLSGGTPSQINASGEYAGLAVDAAGTLYLTRWGVPGFGLGELAASNYAVTLAGIDNGLPGEPLAPLGLGLASDGTIYAGDYGNLDKVDRSQGAINFGEQNTGVTSKIYIVGIYNGGNENLTLANFGLDAGDVAFALSSPSTNPCTVGMTIAPGALCNVYVTMKPPYPGTFGGTITFDTNSLNIGGTSQVVDLNGFVEGAHVTANPASLAFGYQAPNTSATQTVTLTNSGNGDDATINLNSVTLPAGYSISAVATTGPCSGSVLDIAVGFNCMVNITFNPKTEGPANGNIVVGIYYKGGGSTPNLPIPVTGICSQVTLTPATMSFTTSQGSSSGIQFLTLANNGSTAVTLTSIKPGGANPSAFTIGTAQCSNALAGGLQGKSSCVIGVTFNPPVTTMGVVNLAAQVAVTDSDAATSPQIANLTGTATAPLPLPLPINETIHITDNETESLVIPLNIVEKIHVSDEESGLTQPAAPTATTTTVTSSQNPSPLGQSVIFTAKVTPSTATGTVQFSVDGANVGNARTLTAVGVTYTASLSAPSHTIAAAYTPAAGSGYAASSGSITETISAPAALTSPTQGATLAGSSQSFTWNSAAGATGYTLFLGSTGVGSNNLLDAHATATTVTANSLPVNGETIYARLITSFNGVYAYNDYTFTAAAPAALISPTPGATLAGSSQTFTWNSAAGATGYTLFLGSTGVGSNNLLDAHAT